MRAHNSPGKRYGQSSNTQFRAPGFAEREGEVQKQVTPEGVAGLTAEGRCPQIRGFRAGGSLAVASSTPATQLLLPVKMLTLNDVSRPTPNVRASGRDQGIT